MGKPTGLAKEQQRALGRLTKLPELKPFYLGGGTAIGWHLHHRRSNDIDLFSETQVDLGGVERAIMRLSGAKVFSISEVTLRVELDDAIVDSRRSRAEGFDAISGISGCSSRAGSQSRTSRMPTCAGSASPREICTR
jgi:nucleotidyltransferase AbiEii toxin of type IV toxin-antitoxin system